MVASARPAAPARPLGPAALEGETVDRLARWLLLAVAFDLVLTRFVVRLAMFVPKGEPWASLGAVLGRVGAAADALVPIVGVLLLGALLLRSGRVGGRLEPAILVGIGAVAAGGLALVVLPPTPIGVLALDALVACLALAAGVRLLRVGGGVPRIALAGLASLAAALGLAAGARIVGAEAGGEAGLAVDALGQLAFVVGAALVGVAGAADVRRSTVGAPRVRARRLAAAGGLVALVVLAGGAGAPLMWGSLAIWSVGLTAVVPTPLVALAAGLAVAGLPGLHGRAPAAAIGASVVLLAGYGLAASGLVLAGLLGLVVAGSPVERARTWRMT
jgi:hypothetical protein